MTSTEPQTERNDQKVSLPTLTAMVVGSMIGSGVFLSATQVRDRDGCARGDHRVDRRRLGNADAGVCVSAPRHPQARPRRRHLRVRQSRFRGLHRLQLCDRVLGIGLRGKHVVLGAHHGDDERGGARVRRGGHGDRGRGLGDRCVAVRVSGDARSQGCRCHQLHRHHRQGGADPDVHRDRGHRIQGRRLCRQLLGWRRRLFVVGDLGPGHRHHADHRLRLPRDRGRERLFEDGAQTGGRRPRNGHRIPQRAQCFRTRDDGVLRRHAPGRTRRRQPAVHGRGAGIGCRALGIDLHSRRRDRVGARCLPGLDLDVRGGSLHPGQVRGHAEVPWPAPTATVHPSPHSSWPPG